MGSISSGTVARAGGALVRSGKREIGRAREKEKDQRRDVRRTRTAAR
jgi:hypothetical protein